MVERIKILQVEYSSPEEVLDQLYRDGYKIEGNEEIVTEIINVVFAEFTTPAELHKRMYAKCLQRYREENE